jgi:hypothetical protein
MKIVHFSRSLTVIGTMFVVASAFAQRDFIGYHQYPQFRSQSGLPGSGFPIDKNGDVTSNGALSLSTPVAYSLRAGRFVVGGMTVSKNLAPGGFRGKGRDSVNGNGTSQVLAGISLGRAGSLTAGALFLSGRFDSVLNLQWTVPQIRDRRFAFAIGSQDVFGGGASSGTNQPGDGDSSTSIYGVTTYEIDPKTQASFGVGNHRFKTPFGGVSHTLAPNLKLSGEYDGFNINAQVGLLVTVGHAAKKQSLTVAVGVIRGKYSTISANFAF